MLLIFAEYHTVHGFTCKSKCQNKKNSNDVPTVDYQNPSTCEIDRSVDSVLPGIKLEVLCAAKSDPAGNCPTNIGKFSNERGFLFQKSF